MKLTELLDKNPHIEVVYARADEFKTKSKIGDITIEFHALRKLHNINDELTNEFWVVEFWELTPESDKKFKLTGHGNELEVLSMVKKSMEKFIKEYSPEIILFSALPEKGKNNRADLYDKLLGRFKIPGYKFNRSTSKFGGEDEFRIEKM